MEVRTYHAATLRHSRDSGKPPWTIVRQDGSSFAGELRRRRIRVKDSASSAGLSSCCLDTEGRKGLECEAREGGLCYSHAWRVPRRAGRQRPHDHIHAQAQATGNRHRQQEISLREFSVFPQMPLQKHFLLIPKLPPPTHPPVRSREIKK